MTADSSGNLYGTTAGGGDTTVNAYGDGTVFEIAKGSGKITTLASFNGSNGMKPTAGLIMDSGGNLYGTTGWGGPGYTGSPWVSGDGTVFRAIHDGNHTFSPGARHFEQE